MHQSEPSAGLLDVLPLVNCPVTNRSMTAGYNASICQIAMQLSSATWSQMENWLRTQQKKPLSVSYSNVPRIMPHHIRREHYGIRIFCFQKVIKNVFSL